jgi:hypothetical protein
MKLVNKGKLSRRERKLGKINFGGERGREKGHRTSIWKYSMQNQQDHQLLVGVNILYVQEGDIPQASTT